ncbi:MAG: di-heme enzyme, partial [Myxococcota bacterium]|nr:di-heme enzyme [Myxococcota bacterium]
RYFYGGDATAMSPKALQGFSLFMSERLECFHCHGGVNFSDSLSETSTFTEITFHNNGLYNVDGEGGYPADNTGVFEITGDPEDMGRFKAPTLRNIAVTAPYMHDGSIETLEGVIDHYANGGRKILVGENAGDGSESPLKSAFVSGFVLTPDEKTALIAFLESLTDESFLTDPDLSDPFEESP